MTKNKLCPEDIEFRIKNTMALSDQHTILLRDDKYGIQCEKYTKKIGEFDFGKAKVYYFIDGQEKEYTDIQELCDDWNEINDYDDPEREIVWVKMIRKNLNNSCRY